MNENNNQEQIIEFKDSEQRERERKEYKEKLRRHRRRSRLVGLGIVLVLLACAAAFFVYDQGRIFQQYIILWEKNIDQSQGGEVIAWGKGVLQYSKNGASYIEKDGTVLWSVSYEMNHPTAAIQDDYGLITDNQGNTFFICSRNTGMTGSGQTPYAISQGQVAAQGTAALVCENEDISYIYYYKATGERLDIEIKATLDRVGYPLASAISPDGKTLMVSYLYVEGGGMQNKIVFYDFSSETKETVAGTFTQYADTDTVVPALLFADNGHAVAIGDNLLTFYSIDLSGGGRKPSVTKSISLDHQIISMFAENGCVGLVWESTEESDPASSLEEPKKILVLYDTTGNVIFSRELSFSYRNIFYNGTYVVLYNATECVIYTKNGKVKYENSFLNGISQVISGPSSKEFYLITGEKLQRIRLR